MYYLVTGGMGFIGSHLVSSLLEDPASHVTVVDNLSNNAIPATELVAQITADRPGCLETHFRPMADFVSPLRFDRVFHLASIVGPASVLDQAGYISESIVRDTYVAVRLALASRAQLINVSTSEVYGGGERGFCHEDTPRVIRGVASARQEYAAAKASCEVSISNLCAAGQLNAITIRPFNVSGLRQLGQGGFVLPRFVGQALLGRPLTVFGDGSQIRAFTDVRDVASGILMAADRGTSGSVYNVGNPHNRINIKALAELVLDVVRTTSQIHYVDPRSIYGQLYQEAADKFPDASRLMSLGWQPSWTVRQTIVEVYGWLKSLPEEQMIKIAGLDRQAVARRSDTEPIAVGYA